MALWSLAKSVRIIAWKAQLRRQVSVEAGADVKQ